MMKRRMTITGLLVFVLCGVGLGQTTATGTINATLVIRTGISIAFYTDESGVQLANSGTSAATLNFGTISASGTLAAGVKRTSVSPTGFTVSTPFDVCVLGGGTSKSYTLTAQITGAIPTGFSYQIDNVSLTTATQTLAAAGTYNTNAAHNFNLTIAASAPQGTQQSATVSFVATAN